ncbi:MAG TPA: MFS transporter [Opitutaceae bacterium]
MPTPADASPPSSAPAVRPAPAATRPEDRVPLSQKLGYGLGTFIDMWGHWLYPNVAFQVFNIFLGVASWLVGVAVILNRVIDAISDPLFGWLSDNTRTRWGRRRPFMLVGSILAGAGLPFLVAVTPGWGSTHLFGLEISNYFWFMLASSAIYLPIVSCFNMPFQSLGAELTPDYHERTMVYSFRNAVQKIPEVGLFFAGQFFTMAVWVGADSSNVLERVIMLFTSGDAWARAADGAKPNMLLGAQVFLTIAGAIMIIAGLTSFALVRERYYGKLVVGKQSKISIKETLWQTLQCRPFRIQVIMKVAYSLGLSMVGTLGAATTFYYVCGGNLSEGNRWNFLMGLSGMVLGFCGIPVFATIAHKFGKRHALICVFLSAIAVFIGTWWLYTPEIKWLQIFASGSIAFIGAGFYTLDGSIRADVVDFDELQNHRRREGAFAACDSWISKVGMALGAGISFFILDWVGFNPKLEGGQTEHTLFMIRLLLAAIPVVGLIFALVSLLRFPLTQEKMAEIRQQLEARRGTV